MPAWRRSSAWRSVSLPAARFSMRQPRMTTQNVFWCYRRRPPSQSNSLPAILRRSVFCMVSNLYPAENLRQGCSQSPNPSGFTKLHLLILSHPLIYPLTLKSLYISTFSSNERIERIDLKVCYRDFINHSPIEKFCRSTSQSSQSSHLPSLPLLKAAVGAGYGDERMVRGCVRGYERMRG